MLRVERVAITSILLLWILFGFLLVSVACSKIPLGSRLSGGNGYWGSANGNFAIGFFKYCSQYSVGIKFNSSSIPVCEQTVVWLAGANRRVGSNSYFELTKQGELVLFDSSSSQIVWTSNTSNAAVESAVLRNNGNFVLLDQYSNVVWESFGYPSDTLLPGQNLTAGNVLRATNRNSVASVYTLSMDVSGLLQLRWETSVIYWTKGNENNQSDLAVRALVSRDGSLKLLGQESKSIWSVYSSDHADSDVKFRFLRLDSDGNLRLYSWANDSRSWIPVWQAFDNQCGVFATCGLRGICVFNASGSHFCKCPFTSSPGNSSLDCLIPYDPNCASNYSILRYENMVLYGIYPPNETVVQTSLQRCWRLCEEDPNCHAVSFINNGSAYCQLKKTQYVSGWSDPSSGSISLVKTCSDPMAVLPSPMADIANSNSEICTVCVVELSLASCVAFILIQFGVGVYIQRRRRYTAIKSASAYSMPNASGCIMLSYSEIKSLTENFEEQIGPKMFKGVLSDGRLVAVKHLDGSIEERKFRSAVLKIGSICHKNLVKVDAYCCESGYRFLVYEYAKYGSLDKCLEDPGICKRLTWAKRVNICLTVARAMCYLHTGCREFVSHGNLKCQNVILDDELEAKVSEFGLRMFLHDECVAETDVRDFGRMMAVLITGCQNPDDACKWAYERWVKGESEIASDKRIEGGVGLDELERVLRLVFWCLQGDERMRPSMGEVVEVLEGRLPVDPPPPLYSRRHNQTSPEDEESSTPSSTSPGL